MTRRGLFGVAALAVGAALGLKRLRPVDLTGRAPMRACAETHRVEVRGEDGVYGQSRLTSARLRIIDPTTGDHVRYVKACDTAVGTLTVWVQERRDGKMQVRNGRLVDRVVSQDYDVVDIKTGETLHRVRWV